jgi:hypothetical protein
MPSVGFDAHCRSAHEEMSVGFIAVAIRSRRPRDARMIHQVFSR